MRYDGATHCHPVEYGRPGSRFARAGRCQLQRSSLGNSADKLRMLRSAAYSAAE